jgi:hypothetical protein
MAEDDDKQIREWAGYMADLSEIAEFLDKLCDRDDVEIDEVKAAAELVCGKAAAVLERMRARRPQPRYGTPAEARELLHKLQEREREREQERAHRPPDPPMTEGEPDNRMCECQNCDWTGTVAELGRQIEQIPGFFERVDAGEICPVGECPLCRAVAHLVEIPDNTVQIVLAYAATNWRKKP